MSKLLFLTDVAEVPLDFDGYEMYSEIKEYNLPHHEQISKEMCKHWNNMHMENYFSDILKGNIASAKMSCTKDSQGKTVAIVTVVGVPHFRFSEKRRNLVYEQLSAQMSDGWGEGFFHSEFEDENGHKFTVI